CPMADPTVTRHLHQLLDTIVGLVDESVAAVYVTSTELGSWSASGSDHTLVADLTAAVERRIRLAGGGADNEIDGGLVDAPSGFAFWVEPTISLRRAGEGQAKNGAASGIAGPTEESTVDGWAVDGSATGGDGGAAATGETPGERRIGG